MISRSSVYKGLEQSVQVYARHLRVNGLLQSGDQRALQGLLFEQW